MSDADLLTQAAEATAPAAAVTEATMPALDQQPADTPPDDAATKPAKAPKPREVAGLVLVDVPAHGLACGQYVSLPNATAKALEASGEFDPKAPRPE